ncbi:MAG: hypothetical protein ACI8SJ_002130 [Shewanella sp.]|jgi:hypothetical protein
MQQEQQEAWDGGMIVVNLKGISAELYMPFFSFLLV